MVSFRYGTPWCAILGLTIVSQCIAGKQLAADDAVSPEIPLAPGVQALPGRVQSTAEWPEVALQAATASDAPAEHAMEPLPAPGRRGQGGATTGATGFDPAVVRRGRAAFDSACTQCHDADRALSKTKSLAGWLATVRRMAAMDDAEISSSDLAPIATFLASRSTPAGSSAAGGAGDGTSGSGAAAGGEVAGSGLGLSGTVSTLWRGGNDNLENPGFFPDIWLRADWQPSGPVSGRVTSCTSCHSDTTGGSGFTLELVEATARLDLMHWHKQRARETGCCPPPLEASIKAGRMVVPFGAFAAMSHPGIYRTVTNPLMYIMGRDVSFAAPRRPVLPMPYADEGADLEARLDICHDVSATMDLYAVNGLQAGGPGVNFAASRSYTDNNSQPAVGGRATVGNRLIRIGGSVMSGQMQSDERPDPELNYHFAGGDLVIRYEDIVRLYYEYAIRNNDSPFGRAEIVYGNVVEGELLLLSHPKISLVARYDNLVHHDFIGDREVERFTWGINTVLPGGSLLMVDHERWNFPRGEPDVDVVGFRWVATF